MTGYLPDIARLLPDFARVDGFYKAETVLAEIADCHDGSRPTKAQEKRATQWATVHNVCVITGYLGSINLYWVLNHGNISYVSSLISLSSLAAGSYQIFDALRRQDYSSASRLWGIGRGFYTSLGFGGMYVLADLEATIKRYPRATVPEPSPQPV
ncbi:MAG: hypothetical protein JSR46_11250 [Verrucomicrobia bacterium]|nr:hypothetical protein [Verrucomicrobiota bacterium]